MNTELRSKWLAALRSGEYRQHQKALCNEKRDAFCCLGVLAVLNNMADELSASENGPSNAYTVLDTMVGGLGNRQKLVKMNDDQGKSFPEIADWVEKNIPAQETVHAQDMDATNAQ